MDCGGLRNWVGKWVGGGEWGGGWKKEGTIELSDKNATIKENQVFFVNYPFNGSGNI